jgi:hypothetical protein
MISPHFAPQMTIPKQKNQSEFDGSKQRPNKREFNEEKVELSKEERRRIKRERRAMAEAEGKFLI